MTGAASGVLGRRRSAATYTAGAVVLWPVIEFLGGLLSRSHPPLQTVWLRYAAHLGALAVLALPRAGRRLAATRRPVRQLLRGVLMFVMPVAFVAGAGQAPVAAVWTVFWIAPALVLLAAPLLLGERAGAATWASTLLGGVGASVVLWNGAPLGAALLPGIAMAVALAGYLLLSGALRDEPLPTSLFYTGLGALAPLTVVMAWSWTPVGAEELAVATLLGVASLAFLACLDRAVEHGRAVDVAPLLYGVLLAEAAATALLTRTPPSARDIVGLVLVSCALLAALTAAAPTPHTAGTTR